MKQVSVKVTYVQEGRDHVVRMWPVHGGGKLGKVVVKRCRTQFQALNMVRKMQAKQHGEVKKMSKNRIQVLVSDRMHDAIKRIAKGTGSSASKTIGGMLESQEDQLVQLADALDRARELAGPLSQKMQVKLDSLEKTAVDHQHGAQAQMDLLMEELDVASSEASGS